MDELLSIIGLLYDAAVDPDLWSMVLGRLDLFFDTAQSFIAMENAVDPAASLFYGSVDDTGWLKRYAETYMLINPVRLAMTGRVKVGDTFITTDFMTPEEYRATRFSRELLADRDIADIAVAILELTASRVTVLSAQRSTAQGFADETVRQKLQLVMPHAQRAVRIAGLLEHHKMVTTTMADTLDTLVAAVFLLTEDGGIVHSNARGADLMSEQDLVRTVGGRLVLSDRRASDALSDGVERAARGDAALGSEGQAIACVSRTNRKFVATVLPLTNDRRGAIGRPYRATVAVCIKEAEFEMPAAASALAELYNLTDREMTVLTASVEIGGTSDVAEVLGISENTVRSHLKAIYSKTGANRQADLVKLVAATGSPLGHG